MNLALAFTRMFFMVLCVFFMAFYMVSGVDGYSLYRLGVGIALGIIFGTLLIGFDMLFKRFNLRSFNIAILGLFFGYLMGQALVLVFTAILEISTASIHLSLPALEIMKITLFLFGIYLGTLMTLRYSDEIYISIPFVKLSGATQKKKDLLIDSSLLSDVRIIDLAASGLLDSYLILPRFILKDLYASAEAGEEHIRAKAKRSLDVVKKLESMELLKLRFNDTDFPEVKDPLSKISRLGRLLDANILTADTSQVQIPPIEGLRFINIHDLSKALKPLMQTGERIKIKIQRYGKEPRQGVGYLDDGTMVVVNGGGDFIGDVIDVHVLSVKHTTSGRMIFCNALMAKEYAAFDEEEFEETNEEQ
ncbi:MAG TPA: TRAM domain-containing protein [Chlamydiales bacterium]|nr:TRAM domain-containing protein [Chlamydiales bacterium]